MEIESLFYDTYALYEIISGNKSYKKYTRGYSLVTSKLNLMELYYTLLLRQDKKIAERYYNDLLEYTTPLEDHSIKEAMEFKLQHKRKNISYVDAIGYTIAQQRKIRFLTGDKEFKNLPGVEYVK